MGRLLNMIAWPAKIHIHMIAFPAKITFLNILTNKESKPDLAERLAAAAGYWPIHP